MAKSGKDIQKENGFIPIHPAILELLAQADMTAGELKVVLFLLRKTYGWGKKQDSLSYQQIADGTNMKRRGVIGIVQSLIEKNVITASDATLGRNGCRSYGFNKYFERWEGVLNGAPQCTNSGPVNSAPENTNSAQMVHHSALEMVHHSAPTIDKIDTTTTESASADVLPLAERFHRLSEELKTATNRPAKLAEIYALCFGSATVPPFSYLGKVAKDVGGAGRLSQLMFELITRPPAGDVLAFIVSQEKARKKRTAQVGGNREIQSVQFANGANLYD